MTDDDYFALPVTNQPMQLLDGEIIVSPMPTTLHQSVSGKLAYQLFQLIPNGEVFMALIDLHLDKHNVPQPDLVWVMEGGRRTAHEKYLEGAPALIVEIISPSSVRRDRVQKFLLYEQYGVNEYWLVDPVKRYLEVYVLVEGEYHQQGVYSVGETFNSAILGDKSVDMAQIFRMA